MSARAWAAFGLILISALVVFAEPPGTGPNMLLVYLDAGANQNAPALPIMRRETEKLLRTAGYSVEWRDVRGRRGESAPNLVFVDLSGTCGLSASPMPAAATLLEDAAVRLASTVV